jgi:hypothetical protein
MYEYGTLKPMKAILRWGRAKRNNNTGDEPKLGTFFAYMEMSQ